MHIFFVLLFRFFFFLFLGLGVDRQSLRFTKCLAGLRTCACVHRNIASTPYCMRYCFSVCFHSQVPFAEGIGLSVGLFVSSLVYTFSINWMFNVLTRSGWQLRALLITLLYNKSLRLALSGLQSKSVEANGKDGARPNAAGDAKATKESKLGGGAGALGSAGNVTNLMSNDTEMVFEMTLYLHYLWLSVTFVVRGLRQSAQRQLSILQYWLCVKCRITCCIVPVQAVLLGFLIADIGPAAIVGFVLLLLVIPLNGCLGNRVGESKRKMLQFTDKRSCSLLHLLCVPD